MFSSFSQRFGALILDRLDLVVELSTLGEYGVDSGGVFALERERPPGSDDWPARDPLASHFVRTRDDCPPEWRVSRSCRGGAARL
jgi:hypothetical protein